MRPQAKDPGLRLPAHPGCQSLPQCALAQTGRQLVFWRTLQGMSLANLLLSQPLNPPVQPGRRWMLCPACLQTLYTHG